MSEDERLMEAFIQWFGEEDAWDWLLTEHPMFGYAPIRMWFVPAYRDDVLAEIDRLMSGGYV